MTSSDGRLRRKQRRIVGIVLAAVVGWALAYAAIPIVSSVGWAVNMKFTGRAPACSWPRLATFYSDNMGYLDRVAVNRPQAEVVDRDDAGLVQVRFKGNSFWIREAGADKTGPELIAYLHAEQDMMSEKMGGIGIEPGDVVLDVGAHVGVFTRRALTEGAAKVIAVDPDPIQVECLRRNFVDEVAEGRVVIIPKAIWCEEGFLSLHVGHGNSGMSSLVMPGDREGEVMVPTVSIDQLMDELQLQRIDYVKMDIEGAERDALAGARKTLARYRPRLLVETYHLPDDGELLPRLIAQAHDGYSAQYGWCELRIGEENQLVPHFVYTN